MSDNLFMLASRAKYRFTSVAGNLSVEDLWDLPLSDSRRVNLDDIAKGLNRQLKETSEESFVSAEPTAKTNEIKAKFDLVLFVIKVKKDERNQAQALAEKAANKQKIMALIDKKKDEALAGKPLEELQALLANY